MAAIKKPWGKFFWSDWMSDAQLRRCTPAARALWIDMLCIAAQHDPIGYVAVKGQALGASDLGRMLGFGEQEASGLLDELERNGVFSRDRRGRIYSRRMIRDAKKGEIARKNGKTGGNPSLSKDSENPPPDNPPDKPLDNTHILEARSQRLEGSSLSAAPEGCARASENDDPSITIRREICAALSPELPPGDMGRVAMWLAQGYSPAMVRAVVVERIRAGRRPSSLAWFDKALAEAAAVKPPATATPSGPPGIHQPQFPGDSLVEIVGAGWRSASLLAAKVAEWRQTGDWPKTGWGAPPGGPGCYIPARFLLEEVA